LFEGPFFDEVFNPDRVDPELVRVARSLRDFGYAVIDFPDPDFDKRIERIKRRLSGEYPWDAWKAGQVQGLRVQDAWRRDPDVREIASNERILDLLGQLSGRPAFPFQTLNFPVGTQQDPHTDSVHFCSFPERFMCGVWVAFEDIHAESGPLVYFPGSHKLPIYSNEHLGTVPENGADFYGNYHYFVEFWRRLVKVHHLEPLQFHAKKGQALIWAANLLHGGSPQLNKERTRWSQVTHYYFRGCAYYTPLSSMPFLGSIDFRTTCDVSTGEIVEQEINGLKLTESMMQQLGRKALKPETADQRPGERSGGLLRTFTGMLGRRQEKGDQMGTSVATEAADGQAALPADFDAAVYLALHPDVATSGVDARDHYIRYGRFEGRAYKR
jgi:hypothetical protein